MIRCLVVDDEPLARSVLARHIAAVPSLELVHACDRATEAAAYLHEHPVDLLFLDIKMPGMSGMEFLRTLPMRPWTILTTAYSEFAVEAYEFGVVDYLLKPIPFDRFLKAVNRVVAPQRRPAQSASGESDPAPPASGSQPTTGEVAGATILLRADRVDQRVRLATIHYLEAYGNFVKVHTEDGTLLANSTLTCLERALPADHFLRVHRSFIVAVAHVTRTSGSTVHIGHAEIPIGRSFRREVLRALRRGLPGER